MACFFKKKGIIAKVDFAVDILRGRRAEGIIRYYDKDDNVLYERSAVSGSTKTYDHLPFGNYKIMWIQARNNRKGYNPFASYDGGKAWFAYIEPQFKTKRTELGIHPCRLGTKGCTGMLFGKNAVENKLCFDLITRSLVINKKIPFKVINNNSRKITV